jgi:hypothetical protein
LNLSHAIERRSRRVVLVTSTSDRQQTIWWFTSFFRTKHQSNTMKLSSAVIALTFTAVGAFNPATTLSSAVRAKAPFAPRESALVQPINLDGRVVNDKFVSDI